MITLIIWLGMVTVISLMPLRTSVQIEHADLLLHFIIYALTSPLFFVVLKDSTSGFIKRNVLMLSVLAAAGFGLLMEVLQGMVGYRDFSLLDAAANTLGALGGAAYVKFRRTKGR